MMERSLPAFQKWLEDNGICPNYDLIEFRCVDASWGVFAKEEISEGSSLGWIPCSSILSSRNTEIADLLEEEELAGGLALVIATAYERSRKQNSKWAGYFASMPERENLPVFWSDAELECLKGTGLLDEIHQDKQFMEEDFETHLVPLMEKYQDRFKDAPIQLEDFHNAASLVSSRAFFVNKHHGQSMVPFADVFNHKCAIIAVDKEYEMEQEESSTEEEEEGRFSSYDRSSLPPEKRLEITICSSNGGVDGEKGLEIGAAQIITKGHEIHNTYGELSNEELLSKYGFCVLDNPFDSVLLEKEVIFEELMKAIPSSTFKERCRLIQNAEEALEEDVLWNCRIFPDSRTTQSVLMILQIFTDRKDDKEWAHRIASWTPELLSEIVDVTQQKMNDNAWICLRALLVCKLEQMNNQLVSSSMVESVKVWYQNMRIILNEFIKCMDINISVFQGLQLSSNVARLVG